MNSAHDFAQNWVRRHIDAGYQLSSLLDYHGGGGSPFTSDPAYDYALNGSLLIFKDGTPSVSVKYGFIGVSLYWADGHKDTGEFSIRELWSEITNPQPKQLSLWEVQL